MRISDWISDVCSSDLNMASSTCHVVGGTKRVRVERIVRPRPDHRNCSLFRTASRCVNCGGEVATTQIWAKLPLRSRSITVSCENSAGSLCMYKEERSYHLTLRPPTLPAPIAFP